MSLGFTEWFVGLENLISFFSVIRKWLISQMAVVESSL